MAKTTQAMEPPPAPLQIEEKITEFEKELKDKYKNFLPKYKKNELKQPNTLPSQCAKTAEIQKCLYH
jgi:ABC-type transporter MlaC component